MEKYEYKVLGFSAQYERVRSSMELNVSSFAPTVEGRLQTESAQGWELANIAYVAGGGGLLCILRRKLPD